MCEPIISFGIENKNDSHFTYLHDPTNENIFSGDKFIGDKAIEFQISNTTMSMRIIDKNLTQPMSIDMPITADFCISR
jgi:hypothetical protein